MSVVNYFGKMTDFLDFETVKNSNVNKIDDTKENLVADVIDDDFIGDENEFNESLAGYYAFTNASRSVEDVIQDSFIDFDYSQGAKDYCPEDFDLNNEIIDKSKDSGKKVQDFKSTLLFPQGFENIDLFYHALLYAIRYLSKNKKSECVSDDELKKDLEDDEPNDKLFAAKEKLKLDLDIQTSRINAFL